MARGAVKVVSINGALTVTFTAASGSTPAVFSDEACTTSISLPATVSDGASTTFYFASPGSYTLSVKTSGGIQIAGDMNSTKIVTVFAGDVGVYAYDTRLVARDASGDSGRHSPNTDLSAAYVAANRLRQRDLPGVAGIPSLMASPPTVTLGVAGTTTSSIGSAQKVWADRQDAFSYNVGHSMMAYGTSFPDTNYLTPLASSQGNAGSNKVTPPVRVSFYHYGQAFELATKACTSYRMLVDGQYVTAGGAATVTHANNQWVDKFDFGSVALRRIDVDLSSNATPRFGGIYMGPTDSCFAAPQRRLKVAVVSDSFGEGTGANASYQSFAHTLADLGGWTPWSSSWGGTGYLNDSSGTKTTFRSRLATDVLAGAPDVIVWAGGLNDYASFSAAAIGTEAAACYAAATAALPNVQQIVVSPWWRNGVETFPSTLLDARDAIKTAALAAGATFVDLLEMQAPDTALATTLSSTVSAGATSIATATQPSGTAGTASSGATFTIEIGTGANRERRVVNTWTGGAHTAAFTAALVNGHTAGEPVTIIGPALWTGTGKVGATTGVGNSDLYVSSDGTHPTQAGHDAIARAIYAGLTRQLVA